MAILKKLKHIVVEFKGHAPFTLAGTAIGIVCMLTFKAAKFDPLILFKIFHPGHVILSAMVTASIYSMHAKKKSFLKMLLVGYFGAIGVATLSDCIMPYIGEKIFKLDIPSHADVFHGPGDHAEDKTTNQQDNEHVESNPAHGEEGHVCEDDEHTHEAETPEHTHTEEAGHTHTEDAENLHEQDAHSGHSHGHGGLHLGFIEEWYIVNPAAFLGVLIAFLIPRSKCPHAAHVLLSTWASSAHVLMSMKTDMSVEIVAVLAVIIFFSVWVPCCVSDIVFPLLFVDSDIKMKGTCMCHGGHTNEDTEEK